MYTETKRLILLTILLLIGIYLILGFGLGNIQNIDKTVFSTPDTIEYQKTSDCIFRRNVEECPIITRPYLFPLLISIRYFFGNSSIIFLNFTLWILGYYFLVSAVSVLTPKKVPIIITFLLYGFNFAMFAITFRALAEPLLLLLASILIYLIALTYKNGITCTAGKVLLVLSLMAVTKPAFLIHYMGTALFIVIYYLYKKESAKLLLKTMVLPIVILLIQFYLVYINTSTILFSNISGKTFREYFYSQLYAKEHNITRVEAKSILKATPLLSILEYLSTHRMEAVSQYIQNVLSGNLIQPGAFVRKPELITISFVTNVFYAFVYLILITVAVILIVFKKDRLTKYLILSLTLLSTITILEAGISFTQKDRLVMGNIPIFIFFISWSSIRLVKYRKLKFPSA